MSGVVRVKEEEMEDLDLYFPPSWFPVGNWIREDEYSADVLNNAVELGLGVKIKEHQRLVRVDKMRAGLDDELWKVTVETTVAGNKFRVEAALWTVKDGEKVHEYEKGWSV